MKSDFGGLLLAMLIFGIGFSSLLSASNIEATKLNWAQKRCNIFTMFTAFLYRPTESQQSGLEFMKENFAFCMNQNIDTVARSAFAPLFTIFDQLMGSLKFLQNMLNTLRLYIATKMKSFSIILEERFYKFVGVFDKFRAGYARLEMMAGRINAIVLALLFQGISGIRLILNLKDLIIKIVLIIMAILVALCVFAFFLVAPFIPIAIAPVLGALSGIGVYVAGADAFCLHPDTRLILSNGSVKRISTIELGDELKPSYKAYRFPNYVSGILEVDGSRTMLHNYNDIYLSGTHRVFEKGKWLLAKQVAPLTQTTADRLYIVNTLHHWVPVLGSKECIVSDWEEVTDTKGQLDWIQFVEETLNGTRTIHHVPESVPLLGSGVKVFTPTGFKAISSLKIGDSVLDMDLKETIVLGIYKGMVHQDSLQWMSDGNWVYDGSKWNLYSLGLQDCPNTPTPSVGYHCITESGTLKIQSEGTPYKIRDFTECGWKNLEKSYGFLETAMQRADF